MTSYSLSASILSADMTCLGLEVQKAVAAGVDKIHIDVMDQHYVPNLTFGPLICKALRTMDAQLFLDVHLMVQPVDELITAFAKAGASAISFHPEASTQVNQSVALIHSYGCQAGLAINPETPLNVLESIIKKLDFILMMSVNPGFAGQAFISETFDKLRQARALIQANQPACRLAIDGGVKVQNILDIAAAGADTFVVGSALFGQPDYAAVVKQLRAQLAELTQSIG